MRKKGRIMKIECVVMKKGSNVKKIRRVVKKTECFMKATGCREEEK